MVKNRGGIFPNFQFSSNSVPGCFRGR
jgi:hypothetical protein